MCGQVAGGVPDGAGFLTDACTRRGWNGKCGGMTGADVTPRRRIAPTRTGGHALARRTRRR